ncbi:unnamed protein product, partial [Iphiclides podalirius]
MNIVLDAEEANEFGISQLVPSTTRSLIFAVLLIEQDHQYGLRREDIMTQTFFMQHKLISKNPQAIVNNKDVISEDWLSLFDNDFWGTNIKSNLSHKSYRPLTILSFRLNYIISENGITILGFCIVYEVVSKFHVFKKQSTDSKKTYLLWHINRRSWTRIAVVSLAAIFLLYGRWLIMGGIKPEFKPSNNPAAFSTDLFTKVATFHYIYFLNFILLVWPQWLCYDWSMGCIPLIESVLDYRLVSVTLLYLYGFLYIRTILKSGESSKRLMILATSLLIIPYLPAANILFPVGFVIAERILYLPSAGYCLLIAISINKLCCTNKKVYKVVITAYVFLISIYSLKSYRRSFDWQSEYSLFINGLSVCPLNAKVRYNVAKVADARQNTTWALLEYKEAITLYPEYYQAMNNLANLLKNQKQFDEAEFYLRKAVSLKEDFPAAWMNLGIVLANTKRFHESEMAYLKALRYRRNYPDCLYNLGNLYLEMNNTDAASVSWFAAISINPKHAYAWTNLIAMLDNTGQTDKALEIIPKALDELPETPSLIFAIANVYGRINQFELAEAHFKKAIELFNHKVQAIHFANIGVLYHRWKKYDLAKLMYKRALQIDPMFKSAKKNLALLLN